jgi:hypothetical protein
VGLRDQGEREEGFSAALHAEQALIAKQRETEGIPPDAPLCGLALSGGGIRSAVFALGVLQALQGRKCLRWFDYLSTVSGGGYVGSTVTWFKKSGRLDALGQFAAFLRPRGSYLDGAGRLTMMSLAGVVLRTMCIHLTFYLSLLLSAMVLALDVPRLIDPLTGPGAAVDWELAGLPLDRRINYMILGAGLLAVSFVLLSLLYSLFSFFGDGERKTTRYWARNSLQTLGGWLVGLSLLLLAVGLLPRAASLLFHWLGAKAPGVLGALSAMAGAVSAFARFRSQLAGDGKAPDNPMSELLGSPAAVSAGAMLVIYGILLASYDVAVWIHLQPWHGSFLYVLLLALGVGLLTDLNVISLHRMYRDRLMEAFLPTPGPILDTTEWEPADKANRAPLSVMQQRPYHLINANVVVVDSRNTTYRGRGGDSYTLAPLYSGSEATGGWVDTAGLYSSRDGLSLPTAMAISGAAVNAHAGCGGQGMTRDRFVSFLMGLFGLQLGCWINNPAKSLSNPNFFVPGVGFLAPALGSLAKRLCGSSWFHMLTDGGHFENLGLYELIRRRVDIIVAVDGSADPKFAFDGLGAAIERVYADFGVRISFVPHTDALSKLAMVRKCKAFPGVKVADSGFVTGQIVYPERSPEMPAKTGRLIYVKSTVIDTVPANVFTYLAAHPGFPNQTTADQFFDEKQMEAYRSLGEHIGRSLPPLPQQT